MRKIEHTEYFPKVSVIVPVYNVEKYLKKCLDSVICQTLTDIEIICVDDASTDKSYEIVEDFARRDGRIKISHSYDDKEKQQNYGLSATRNRGLKIAKGEYVLFLDSDDWLELDALERLYNFAHGHELDVLCYDFVPEYEDEELKKKFNSLKSRNFSSECVISGENLFVKQCENYGYYGMAPLMFCRNGYCMEQDKEKLFYEGILHEDLLYCLTVLMDAKRAASVDWKLYHYLRRKQSTTTLKVNSRNCEGVFVFVIEAVRFINGKSWTNKVIKTVGCEISRYIRMMLGWFYDIDYENTINTFSVSKERYPLEFEIFKEVFKPYYTNIIRKLTAEELKLIKSVDSIIVYGAGYIGRKVLSYLSENGFNRVYVAVTHLDSEQYFMGNKVCEISDLTHIKDDSVVLVSVTAEKQDKMVDTLNRLGFKNWICI